MHLDIISDTLNKSLAKLKKKLSRTRFSQYSSLLSNSASLEKMFSKNMASSYASQTFRFLRIFFSTIGSSNFLGIFLDISSEILRRIFSGIPPILIQELNKDFLWKHVNVYLQTHFFNTTRNYFVNSLKSSYKYPFIIHRFL